MTARTCVRVRIYGHVQGVWYRGWTVDAARARGLAGWVRNRKDGTVEASFAGDAASVEAMIEACRQGPPMARVDTVERADAADEGWMDFSQLPTTE
jgi:acylphosphatase